jgi:hypothetical protein
MESLNIPYHDSTSGRLIVVDNLARIPFTVNRLFYIYDIPYGESRGSHAHKECHQLIIPVVGSFKVSCFDGSVTEEYSLNKPHIGLHVKPGIWAHEFDFSAGAVCLVLCSHGYEEDDYIRNFEEFLIWKNK